MKRNSSMKGQKKRKRLASEKPSRRSKYAQKVQARSKGSFSKGSPFHMVAVKRVEEVAL